MVKGTESTWGSLSCGCHPNCGVGTAMMINKETKEWAPVPRFLDAVQLTKDVTAITDAARGKNFSNFMMAMALLKNYKPFQGPKGLTLGALFKKFDKTWALTKKSTTKYGRTSPDRKIDDAMKRRQDPWNFLFIAGMWFQDLFNYDFRRTEMCIIPYATQQGEISFCAYNTGVGWRQIIENMHKNATVAEWYKNHGKHEIYAKGKSVNLQSFEHSLKIDSDDAARVRHLEHDIPLTAAEEDRIRRKNAQALQEQAKVRAIYEELVLKKPQPTVVQIGSVSDIAKAVPANFKPVTIAPANGHANGNGHSDGNGASAPLAAEKTSEAVAGD
jgi:acylphosphatase